MREDRFASRRNVLRYLLPLAVLLHFQAHVAGLLRVEWVELGSEFEDIIVHRIDAEADDFIAWHFQVGDGVVPTVPPIVDAERVFPLLKRGFERGFTCGLDSSKRRGG